VAQFGSADALGALGRRFESCHPDHKTHFMKMQEISELESFTVEEFQSDFDNLMERIESGESFIIKSEHGNVVMVPYKEVVQVFEEVGVSEDIIRIHTDHEEGS
jgi:hypothetical protein